jgi:7,8-dihydro-6-hydroxymethylpterin dimethyltransferase
MSLVRRTRSVCPRCRAGIDADVVEEDGRIFLDKTCPVHGRFRDLVWSEAATYHTAASRGVEGRGLANPRTAAERGCPWDCGICPDHRSATLLAIVDVTNRCNLRCPVCFADAASPRVYEPSFERISAMLENLRANRPAPPPALQFSGGEPTLRDDLPDLIRRARQLGFRNVQVNTNGVRMAESASYVRTLTDAGLQTLYLQFDGLTADVYRYTRGRDLVATKARVLEHCRAAGLRSVVLVVTLVKGVNDGQMGDIVRFAADHFDVVRCVNSQPVSFTGRTAPADLRTRRITIADVVRALEEQTGGAIAASDFFPVPSVVPLGRAVAALRGKPSAEFTAHPHCGTAVYILPEDGRIVPLNRRIRIERFLAEMDRVAEEASSGRRLRATARLMASFRFVRAVFLWPLLWSVIRRGAFEAVRGLHYKMILVSAMHFMDLSDFDEERVKRCVIHYVCPDGRIIPFCAYNNLGYREDIEKRFSFPGAAADTPA